jgi:hypothetical protein
MLTYLGKLLYVIYHLFRVATFVCLSPSTSDGRGRRKHPCYHVVYDSKTSAVKYACQSQNFCFAVKHQRSVRNTSGATLQRQKSQQRAPTQLRRQTSLSIPTSYSSILNGVHIGSIGLQSIGIRPSVHRDLCGGFTGRRRGRYTV